MSENDLWNMLSKEDQEINDRAWSIEMAKLTMSKLLTGVCAVCDCVCDLDEMYYSLAAAGPFCGDCWAGLTDADQALLMQKELEQAEDKIQGLQEEVKSLEDEIKRLENEYE